MFTGLPVGWFAIFDWQFSKQELLDNPQLYKIGLKNRCFSPFIFWRWWFYATWQSLFLLLAALIYIDASMSYGYSIVQAFFNQSNQSRGVVQSSVWTDGTFILQAIIALVTVKIIVSTSTHTFWSSLLPESQFNRSISKPSCVFQLQPACFKHSEYKIRSCSIRLFRFW